MRKTVRAIAAGLALSLIVPVLSACSSKTGDNSIGGSGDPIADDAPWYNVTEVAIGNEIDSGEYQNPCMEYVGESGDDYVFRLTANKQYPDEDLSFYEGLDYRIDNLRVYDISGNLVNTVDCVDILRALPDVDGGYIDDINVDDEGYFVSVTGYDSATGTDKTYTCRVDFESGTAGELIPGSVSADEYIERLDDEGAYREDLIHVGDYTVDPFWISGDVNSYVFEVKDAGGNVTELDMRELFPSANILSITGIIDIGNNRGLAVCYGYGGSSLFFEIDFNGMSVTDSTADMGFLADKVTHLVYLDGYGTVVRDIDGIYSLDYENKSLEPLFLYSYANLNMYELRYMSPVAIGEERAVFAGDKYSPSPVAEINTVMYVFDKADSNPNTGKTVLELASASDYSYALCEAVRRFNESNSECFIRFNSSYNVDAAVTLGGDSQNDESIVDEKATELGNQLAVDIMSGTGPDIIVNGDQFVMLNNDSYLIDLSDYIGSSFTSDNYFTNVFDAAKDGDKLYHVPLTFRTTGIVTDSANVAPGQVGFTFEQYEDFVYGVCNGSDPIDQGKMHFFINSFNCMSDLFMVDGRVDYNCDAFRTLAEYTSMNVNDPLVSDDEYVFADQSAVPAKVILINGIGDYFDSVMNGDKVILGIPSYDGRGPVIVSSDSVAVSSMTSNPEACMEFVSILLGDDVQASYGYHNGIPVNKAAFTVSCNMLIDYQSYMIDSMRDYMSEAEMRMYGYNTDEMDESVIGEFESFVSGLTGWYSNDAAVNSIIREEVPAYFEGQKALDQVIPVLEDRINTFLVERS